MNKIKLFFSIVSIFIFLGTNLHANEEINALKEEIKNIQNDYETRIKDLESKLSNLEKDGVLKAKAESVVKTRKIYGNEFNPSIGIVLNGKYNNFSMKSAEPAVKGFAIGHEGERGREGLQLGESELNFSSPIDDKFYGSMTYAIVQESDTADAKVELEEAYIMTTPNFNLPEGMSLKAGRAFWTLGYMNEHHAHADDFANRPLPYRVYLNKGWNDTGAEISYILPTDYYAEVGAGMFRGNDYPIKGPDGESAGATSAYARIGGDIDQDQNWRLGVYIVDGENPSGRKGNEDEIVFKGDTTLYVTDFRYSLAPTGNVREQELTLQAELFARNEDGTYNIDSGGENQFNGTSYGWYVQSVYKFNPQWRAGLRYSQMETPGVPTALIGTDLDGQGFDPTSVAVMADWTNSEFSRIRWQFNQDKLASGSGSVDNQFTVQYLMSIGAHGAHKY